MYRRDFSGYLRKLGQLPACITDKLHMFGSNANYFMGMICKSSVRKLRSRWKRMFSIAAILLMWTSSVLNGMYDAKETNRACPAHSPLKCEVKVRSEFSSHVKPDTSQEVSYDTYFHMDLSQVVNYNENDLPVPHYLKTHEDDPRIDGDVWEQGDTNITPPLTFQEDSESENDDKCPNDLLSNKVSESLFNKVGTTAVEDMGPIYQMHTKLPLGSNKYCLMADIERLTLLNEKKENKQEKDDFFLHAASNRTGYGQLCNFPCMQR